MAEKEIKEDFLEVDPDIPGQKYVCLSFVSPENVLRNKDVFFVHNFLKSMASKYDLSVDDIEEKYKDFLFARQEDLEKKFFEENDFQTSIRGLKVRGVYDTLKEAQVRSKVLQRRDKNFNVYVGQVGYWLPWDPNPLKVENQEYAEEQLNELVKKYKENQEAKDLHFQENLDYVKEQAAKKAAAAASERKEAKKTNKVEAINDTNSEPAPVSETKQEPFNVVDKETVASLEATDPWLQRKQETSP
jgi:Family of unknown function (DUF5832)